MGSSTSATSPWDTATDTTTGVPSSGTKSTAPTTLAAQPSGQLPAGGRTILPKLRVVAFYGGPDGPGLGVLGAGTPDQAADAVERRAQAFASYGRPVQPAMELIATVAQGSPGGDGDYSGAISNKQIRTYLAAAHAHHMLLILDIQPGGGEFLPQVRRLQPFLLDASVSVGLDPEWKVPFGDAPGGGRIGSSSAASINAVGRYLSGLVRSNHLPDKLLVIHQFSNSMLPDRRNIRSYPGVETVMHADGEGSPALKVGVYRQLGFGKLPFHAGFKVFFTEDTRLMSPAEIMALHPRPDIVTYQ